MAKVTPPQNIPAELLDGYRASLGEMRPEEKVRKRYPYRVPTMQTLKGHPSAKQKAQRARLLGVISQFNDTSWADRQRWYAAMPPWGSFLWYYNYFILSAFMYDANVSQGGAGVIKTIQMVKEEVPTTGGKGYVINAVAPAKTVVMLYGNSYISDTVQRFSGVAADDTEVTKNLSPNVDTAITEVRVSGSAGYSEVSDGSGSGMWGDWYCSSLSVSQVKIKLVNIQSATTHGYYIEVIEHKAQTIYPVIVSIAAELVTIDWAKVPSVAADVSIIVIEYV